MNLNFLFSRHDPGTSWRDRESRQEPQLNVVFETKSGGANAQPSLPPTMPSVIGEDVPSLPLVVSTAQVRNMSPRQMADWAHEMYLAGAMSWDEFHTALPAELHPDYDRTVGALTGQRARPDRPRDMVKEWEDKLDFVRRHNSLDRMHVQRAERIVALLRRQDSLSAWGEVSSIAN